MMLASASFDLMFASLVLKSATAMMSSTALLVHASLELVWLILGQVLGERLPEALCCHPQLGIVLDHRPTCRRDGVRSLPGSPWRSLAAGLTSCHSWLAARRSPGPYLGSAWQVVGPGVARHLGSWLATFGSQHGVVLDHRPAWLGSARRVLSPGAAQRLGLQLVACDDCGPGNPCPGNRGEVCHGEDHQGGDCHCVARAGPACQGALQV